jgi:MarR family transcriptional regulator, negative regulator of the multidrug operon emrRAB
VPDSENRRLENLFGTLLTALSDSLVARAEQAAGHSGATAAALTYLVQEPGLGIDQLKDPLGLSQSATVRLVDRLVADGLVERRPGRDGRSISVHLTPPGESVAQQILDQRLAVLAASLASLGQVERCAMTGLVEKILGDITEDIAHAERICRLCDLTTCPLDRCPVTLAAEQAASRGTAAVEPGEAAL